MYLFVSSVDLTINNKQLQSLAPWSVVNNVKSTTQAAQLPKYIAKSVFSKFKSEHIGVPELFIIAENKLKFELLPSFRQNLYKLSSSLYYYCGYCL